MAIDILDSLFYDSSKDKKRQDALIQQGIDAYSALELPDYEKVNYKAPDYVGDVIAPEAEAVTMGDTAYRGISVDPNLRKAQLAQLAALEELRDSGGMTLADKANLESIQRDSALQAKSERDAIMQQAAMRGQAGSNMTLANILQAQQAGQNRLSDQDLKIAAMAQERALKAGGLASGLAGDVRGQDFGEQARIAEAEDAANKFNASIRSGMNQFNVSNTLRAAQGNQASRQGVANVGAQYGKEAEMMNKYQMPTTSFGQNLNKTQGQVGQYNLSAQQLGQDIANKQAAQSNLWSSAAQIGAGLATGGASTGLFAAGKALADRGAKKTSDTDTPTTLENYYDNTDEEDKRLTGFWGV